jgi:hypothetical protein
MLVCCLAYSTTLKMEAKYSYETLTVTRLYGVKWMWKRWKNLPEGTEETHEKSQ